MDTSNIITLLNEDLRLEYAAAIQYYQHASVINGLHTVYAQELRTHASEELGHAQKISDFINYLGGTPVAEVGQTLIAFDNQEMLGQDLDGENVAIDRYKQRIEQAVECGLYGLQSILLGIIEEEESHANDLKTILGQ